MCIRIQQKRYDGYERNMTYADVSGTIQEDRLLLITETRFNDSSESLIRLEIMNVYREKEHDVQSILRPGVTFLGSY